MNYRNHSESPFGAVFEVKKLFIKDYSPTFDDPSKSCPVQNISTQNNIDQLEVVQTELVKTLIQVGELKNDLKIKDVIINKLNK